jgi:hypothetical protein
MLFARTILLYTCGARGRCDDFARYYMNAISLGKSIGRFTYLLDAIAGILAVFG